MPSEQPRQRLQDILDNIASIEQYVLGVDAQTFGQDAKTRDAVERCLERISEASRKLGDLAEKSNPEIPWRQIRDLGNVLRHAYDAVSKDRLWLIIVQDLPPLKTACEEMIRELS